MTERFVTRTSDGSTIDLKEEEAEQADPSTGSKKVLDFEHFEVHEGHSFYAEYISDDLDIDGVMSVLLVTPNTPAYIHLLLRLMSSKGMKFELFENTDSTGGTSITAYNKNRNSSNASTLTITHTPTITSNGTLLQSKHVGSAGKYAEAGETFSKDGWILKQNSKYLLKVVSHEDDNEIVLGISWYVCTH